MYPILIPDTQIAVRRNFQSYVFLFVRPHGRKDSLRQAHGIPL